MLRALYDWTMRLAASDRAPCGRHVLGEDARGWSESTPADLKRIPDDKRPAGWNVQRDRAARMPRDMNHTGAAKDRKPVAIGEPPVDRDRTCPHDRS